MDADENVRRVEILTRAMTEVNRAAKSGGVISVSSTARRLLAGFPACRISATDLETEIARLATTEGVPVEFG